MIKAYLLTTGSDNSAKTTYTTASITPTPGRLVIVSVGNIDGSGSVPMITSVTGCGLTFSYINTRDSSDGKQRASMWKGVGTPTTGTLSITFENNASDNANWIVTEYSGVDLSNNGANAVVQSATARVDGSSATGLTVNLSAFAKPKNAVIGTIRINNSHAITPGTGFTELAELLSPHTLEVEFKDSEDTTVNWTFGSTTDRMQAIAAELKAGNLGGAFLYNLL